MRQAGPVPPPFFKGGLGGLQSYLNPDIVGRASQ